MSIQWGKGGMRSRFLTWGRKLWRRLVDNRGNTEPEASYSSSQTSEFLNRENENVLLLGKYFQLKEEKRGSDRRTISCSDGICWEERDAEDSHYLNEEWESALPVHPPYEALHFISWWPASLPKAAPQNPVRPVTCFCRSWSWTSRISAFRSEETRLWLQSLGLAGSDY